MCAVASKASNNGIGFPAVGVGLGVITGTGSKPIRSEYFPTKGVGVAVGGIGVGVRGISVGVGVDVGGTSVGVGVGVAVGPQRVARYTPPFYGVLACI